MSDVLTNNAELSWNSGLYGHCWSLPHWSLEYLVLEKESQTFTSVCPFKKALNFIHFQKFITSAGKLLKYVYLNMSVKE